MASVFADKKRVTDHDRTTTYGLPTRPLTNNRVTGVAGWDSSVLGCSYDYPAGVRLFAQDQPVREAFVLAQGILKIVVSCGDGGEAFTNICTSPWLAGGSDAIVSPRYQATVATVTQCSIHRIPLSVFRQQLDVNRAFSRQVQELLSREAITHLRRLSELMVVPAAGRLQRLLTQFAKSQHAGGPGPVRLMLPLQMNELADLLSITPEYLSRLITRLEKDGFLRRQKGWIVLNSATSEEMTPTAGRE